MEDECDLGTVDTSSNISISLEILSRWTVYEPSLDWGRLSCTEGPLVVHRHIALAAFATLFAGPLAASEPFAISFSFKGTTGCKTLFPNPEIRLQNLPAGGSRVLIRLRGDKGWELGGQEITLPASGTVPAGAIHTFAPCNPGLFSYQVTVKSATGGTIGEAEASRLFPDQ